VVDHSRITYGMQESDSRSWKLPESTKLREEEKNKEGHGYVLHHSQNEIVERGDRNQ